MSDCLACGCEVEPGVAVCPACHAIERCLVAERQEKDGYLAQAKFNRAEAARILCEPRVQYAMA